jgi:hypothetical protein
MNRLAVDAFLTSARSVLHGAIAVLPALLLCESSIAQSELVFVRQPVAQQSGSVNDIAPSPDGGAYMIESFAPQNTLLTKLRRDGSVEWNVTVLNVAMTAIDVDASGAISACGNSGIDAMALRFTPNGSEVWRTTLPSISHFAYCVDGIDSGELFVGWREEWPSNGCLVSKFSALGGLVWSRQVTSSGPLRIAATSGGSVFYAGSSDEIGRIQPNGAIAWSFGISSLYISANDVCLDTQGSAIFCGRAGSNSTFGSPIGFDDALIFRVLPGGAINWVRRFGTPYYDNAQRVVSNGSSFVIAGDSAGRFGGTPSGSWDAWICEIDAVGTMHWSNQLGSAQYEYVQGLASDSLGGHFVLGDGGGPIPASGSPTSGQWIARFGYFDCFTDADGDTFGDGDIELSPSACSNGLSFLDSDCDDTRVSVYPGAPELCDGLDNDCDGTIDEGFISTYCTSGTSTNGCSAVMSYSGLPSTTAGSGFQLTCSNVEGQRFGLILYGAAPGGALWAINGTSYVCVAPPQGRTNSQQSGGTLGACDGSFTLDFNHFIAGNPTAVGSPYSPGQVLYAQSWYRDPAAPKGSNLSNGIQFALCN